MLKYRFNGVNAGFKWVQIGFFIKFKGEGRWYQKKKKFYGS